jgi:hypothetical protein
MQELEEEDVDVNIKQKEKGLNLLFFHETRFFDNHETKVL